MANEVTPEEEREAGAYRLLKARRQSEAFLAQTRALSQSQSNTPPTTASTSNDSPPLPK